LRRSIPRAVPALVLAAALAVPSVAIPCMNPVMIAGDKATRQVKRAEAALARGDHRTAIRLASPAHVSFEDEALAERALVIANVATLRHDPRSARRVAGELEVMLEDDPENPTLKARLAEALSLHQEPERREQGRLMLEDLAQRDLVPDAEAYATLGKLRAAAGDAEGRDQALAQCRQRTRRRAICALPCSRPARPAKAAARSRS
jgi:hypothetical protein